MKQIKRIGGSFRDPSGFVYVEDGIVYRQVAQRYRASYDALIMGGLYEDLVERRLLIPHSESEHPAAQQSDAYKTLCPRQIPMISYPYEWCFSQLKDAALATLAIQKRALLYDMILKDASAYNIQFLDGAPTLIDTLSFERYQDGESWIAYKQFCQHFLAPLALMSYKDVRLSQSLRAHMDGFPLDLAASLLPRRSYLNLGIVMHILLHSWAQRRHSGDRSGPSGRKKLAKQALLNIVDNLSSTIRGFRWDHGETAWASYYAGDSYRDTGFDSKHRAVSEFIEMVNPKCVWDLGANTGHFSRIASRRGIDTVSIDSDPGVVEANYRQAKREADRKLHPLLIDLTNPSPSIGWANHERDSLSARANADCALALALIHHLAISNNVPLREVAAYFAGLAEWLIIEFVPKTDNKVQGLLSTREDIFEDYNLPEFVRVFSERFVFIQEEKLCNSERTLYLLKRRTDEYSV